MSIVISATIGKMNVVVYLIWVYRNYELFNDNTIRFYLIFFPNVEENEERNTVEIKSNAIYLYDYSEN